MSELEVTKEQDAQEEQRKKMQKEMRDWTEALEKRDPEELLNLMLNTAFKEDLKNNVEDWVDQFFRDDVQDWVDQFSAEDEDEEEKRKKEEEKRRKKKERQKAALRECLQIYITAFVKTKGSIKGLVSGVYASQPNGGQEGET